MNTESNHITPVFILIRFIDYDEATDTIAELTPNSPCFNILISGIPCYPVFTDAESAARMRDNSGLTDKVVACDRQRMLNSAGQMFAVEKLLDRIIPMDSVPKMQRVVRGVDRAATKDGGCYTASVLLGIKGEQVFILDVMRGQPPRAIMAGMTKATDLCAGGCGRPVEAGQEYCCPCCEAVAAFIDPTMTMKPHEHDQP